MTVIKMRDLRACGICPEVKKHFFERHDIDWRDFVMNGAEADYLRSFGDRIDTIDRLEKAAKEREARNGRQ